MIDWLPVEGSTRVVAEAYDLEAETIYVRFTDGVEFSYSNCPPHVWKEFSAPGQSRGQYIRQILDFKPKSKLID